MNHKALPTVAAWCLVALIGIALVFARDAILPEKYSFDSSGYSFESMIEYSGPWSDGDSKQNTARLYSALGITGKLSETASNTLFFLYGFAAFLIVLGSRSFNPGSAFWLVVWYTVFAIYTIQYTKEHLALFVTLAMYWSVRKRHPLVFLTVLVPYALYFRDYWAIYAVTMLGCYFVFLRFYSWKRRFILIVLMLLSSIVALSFIADFDLSGIRYRMNEHRLGSGVAQSTIINPITSTGLFADIINTSYAYFSLVLPVQLILELNVLYFTFGFVQLWFILCLIAKITRSEDDHALLVLSTLIAFLFVQAIFVPDYGAYLRHLTVILPILLTIRPSVFFVFRKSGARSVYPSVRKAL